MFYFPFDFTFIVRRVLAIVRPAMVVLVEGEIWPNLLRECRRTGVKTIVVNGRVSNRSYPRYRLVRPLFRRVLATSIACACRAKSRPGASWPSVPSRSVSS